MIKASYHNGRNGNPHHNDRDFNLDDAPHIIQEKTDRNKYVCIYPGMAFAEAERKFYKDNFSAMVKERNDRNIRTRHKDRVITTDDLLKSRKTMPEETILQIGNIHNYPGSPNDMLHIFNELQRYSNKISHHHCKLLDAALHMDESTPHIHIRRVWIYEENGINKIGQEKALKQAGIPLPDPSQPEGRYNNRKMVYDRMMREKFYELCEERGIEIDRTVQERRHLDKISYITREIEKERELAEQDRIRRQQIENEK